MLHLSLAGNLGRDAEHKTTQSGQDLCSFAVAVNVGFGENKSTVWVDVTRWGKGAEGLARILRKGSKVAVIGGPPESARRSPSSSSGLMSSKIACWCTSPRRATRGPAGGYSRVSPGISARSPALEPVLMNS